MRKIYLFTILALALLSCSSDDGGGSSEEAAFENLNDVTTVEVQTTIPRLEISQSNGSLMVLLSVTDQDGIPLEQFTLGNYTITITVDGGTPQTLGQNELTLTVFDQTNNNPLAAATTMDYSGSMGFNAVQDMEAALRNFISLKSGTDLMSIIKFASTVEEVQSFTTDKTLLETAIETHPFLGSSTAFYSACELGLDTVNNLNNVLPVVIGFTDGNDNRSTISFNDLILKSQSLSIPIYTVGFGGADQISLNTLASETGGRYFYAPTSEDISTLYETINKQLRKLYIFEWIANYSSGTEITIEITTEYTAGNGSFTDVSTKTIIIQ